MIMEQRLGDMEEGGALGAYRFQTIEQSEEVALVGFVRADVFGRHDEIKLDSELLTG
ncbi:hypothetical protein BH18ACT6_BH18ACT6_25640 [soil metagenome]